MTSLSSSHQVRVSEEGSGVASDPEYGKIRRGAICRRHDGSGQLTADARVPS